MARTSGNTSTRSAAKVAKPPAPAKRVKRTKRATSAAVPRPRKRRSAQAAPASTTGSLPEVRRTNLALLTRLPGSKSALARLMDLSPANISHRLHGVKLFDDEQAQLFSGRLRLPRDWFDKPRKASEVPAKAMELLTQRSSPAGQPGTGEHKSRGRPKGSKGKTPLVTGGATGMGESQAASELLEAVTAPVGAVVHSAPSTASTDSPAAAAGRNAAESMGEVPAIVEALLKTIAIQAREGKLTESDALKMLGQLLER